VGGPDPRGIGAMRSRTERAAWLQVGFRRFSKATPYAFIEEQIADDTISQYQFMKTAVQLMRDIEFPTAFKR
jgi:hypothetical protein